MLTNTLQSVLCGFVSCVTGTLVAADHVDTLAVPAQPVAQVTFIDVCERESNDQIPNRTINEKKM